MIAIAHSWNHLLIHVDVVGHWDIIEGQELIILHPLNKREVGVSIPIGGQGLALLPVGI